MTGTGQNQLTASRRARKIVLYTKQLRNSRPCLPQTPPILTHIELECLQGSIHNSHNFANISLIRMNLNSLIHQPMVARLAILGPGHFIARLDSTTRAVQGSSRTDTDFTRAIRMIRTFTLGLLITCNGRFVRSRRV